MTPNPNGYVLSPIVAWNWVQLKSRIIEGKPMAYEEAAAAVGHIFCHQAEVERGGFVDAYQTGL